MYILNIMVSKLAQKYLPRQSSCTLSPPFYMSTLIGPILKHFFKPMIFAQIFIVYPLTLCINNSADCFRGLPHTSTGISDKLEGIYTGVVHSKEILEIIR